MKNLIQKFWKDEKFRFLLVGGIATLLQWGFYSLFCYLLPHTPIAINSALVLSYIASLIFNFYATHYFTFSVKPTATKGAKFLLAHAINAGMQAFFLNIFLYAIGIPNPWAMIPVFAICVPINFLLVRLAVVK